MAFGFLTPFLRIGGIIAFLVGIFNSNGVLIFLGAGGIGLSVVTSALGRSGHTTRLIAMANETVHPYGKSLSTQEVLALWNRDNSEFLPEAQQYKASNPGIFVDLRIQCFREACKAWALGDL